MKFLVILTVGCIVANTNAWIVRDAVKRIQGNDQTFAALDENEQREILQKSDFASFVQKAEENDGNADVQKLIVDIYKQKFGDKIVDVGTRRRDGYLLNSDKNALSIDKFDVISKVFKYFGDAISTVRLYSKDSEKLGNLLEAVKGRIGEKTIDHEGKEIVKIINDYSNNALKDLTLSTDDMRPLTYVNQSFANVENLTIYPLDLTTFKTLRSRSLQLNEIFPNMIRLDIGFNVMLEDDDILAFTFSQLKDVQVEGLNHKNGAIVNLVKSNPTIQSFNTVGCSVSVMQALSDLPNLENLELRQIELQRNVETNTQFKDVKHLKLQGSFEGLAQFAQNVHFGQLEELIIVSRLGMHGNDVSNEWIEFIQGNSNLKKLHFYNQFLNTAPLASLTGKLPNLVDAHFRLHNDIEVETIAAFLKASSTLDSLKVFNLSFEQHTKLLALVENEWTISQTDQKMEFLIKRK